MTTKRTALITMKPLNALASVSVSYYFWDRLHD